MEFSPSRGYSSLFFRRFDSPPSEIGFAPLTNTSGQEMGRKRDLWEKIRTDSWTKYSSLITRISLKLTFGKIGSCKGRMYIISLFEMFRERIERRGRNCGRERNNGMWEGVEGRSEDIYGSKKYNRIARLWQTTGNGDEEPIIAGARVRTGEIINPKP